MAYLIIFLIGFIAGGFSIMAIAVIEMASDHKRGAAGVDEWIVKAWQPLPEPYKAEKGGE